MKKLFTTLFLTGVMVFSLSTFISAQEEKDMMKMVEEMGNEFEKYMLENNYDAMYGFYSEDIISLPSYQPMIKGLDNIKKMNEEMGMMNFTAFEMTPVEVLTAGNYLIEIGTYKLTMEIPGMEQPYDDAGKYLNVYEKNDEGEWKLRVETWNTDTNPWISMDEPEGDAPENK